MSILIHIYIHSHVVICNKHARLKLNMYVIGEKTTVHIAYTTYTYTPQTI